MYASSESFGKLALCAGLPEPSLLDSVISTKILCAGQLVRDILEKRLFGAAIVALNVYILVLLVLRSGKYTNGPALEMMVLGIFKK